MSEWIANCASWARAYIDAGGAYTGRIYFGSADSGGMGSGLALPQSQHGGPGRAGGGSELGGLRALELYTQRVALQGAKVLLDDVGS